MPSDGHSHYCANHTSCATPSRLLLQRINLAQRFHSGNTFLTLNEVSSITLVIPRYGDHSGAAAYLLVRTFSRSYNCRTAKFILGLSRLWWRWQAQSHPLVCILSPNPHGIYRSGRWRTWQCSILPWRKYLPQAVLIKAGRIVPARPAPLRAWKCELLSSVHV